MKLKEDSKAQTAKLKAESKAQTAPHAAEQKAAKLMEEVRELGHYPEPYVQSETTLYKQLSKARVAALFQPADEAELQEFQCLAQREKEAADIDAAARVAAAEALFAVGLQGQSADSIGDMTYGTIEWIKFARVPGLKDLLRFVLEWEGFDTKALPKNATARYMITLIAKQRDESNTSASSAAQPADPNALLISVADKVKQTIQGTADEAQGFPTRAIEFLAKLTGLTRTAQRRTNDLRSKLIQLVSSMLAAAETAQLNLSPYAGDSACTAFLYWCVHEQREKQAAEAQADFEQEVDQMAPFADDAEHLMEQDLM